MQTIAVLGTFDTKGRELAFVGDAIRREGLGTVLIDVGSLDPPTAAPDLSRHEVLAELPEDTGAVLDRRDRGECVALMGRAAARLLVRLAAERKIAGVISLGGGGGTALGTAAMRALPLGFPKLMVSTLASGNTAAYIGNSDIAMLPAIVDVAGINRISRVIFENAAGAICGMVRAVTNRSARPSAADKPIVVASMFGNTTTGVNEARRILEEEGYEVVVFHATGAGGRAMESLIASGLVAGVLDITTTEWADELVGGILTAGPGRLDAAAVAGVPAIVAPGCLDMVNFGERSTVPAKFAGRTFYQHNPQVTLMRTNATEAAELGRIVAGKVNAYRAPVTVLLPRRALSVISAAGQVFHDPVADAALFTALRTNLRSGVELLERDMEINDPAFARLCAEALLKNMAHAKPAPPM